MNYIRTTAIILTLFFVPLVTQAETVLRVGSDLSVGAEQVVDGDYYGSVGPFGSTDMSGTVNGDALLLAGDAIINGPVSGDVSLLAFSAQLNGAVGDDARLVAGEVTVADSVAGDLFVMAGTLKILSSATITGNVYFFGGDAVIQGTVEGGVFGAAERMRFDGSVGGTIDVKVPAGLTLGANADVGGDVLYTSGSELVRAQESQVAGKVTQRSVDAVSDKETVRDFLTPLFIFLFANLSLYLLFKRELVGLVRRIDESLLYSIATGAGALLAGPIVVALLLFTVLGIILGAMLAGSLLFVYAAAFALSGVVLGAYVYRYATGSFVVTPVSVVVGTVLMQLAWLVPVLGTILVTLVFFITIGGLVRGLYYTLQT